MVCKGLRSFSLSLIVIFIVSPAIANTRVYASDVKPKALPGVDFGDYGDGEASRFHFSTGMYLSTGSVGSKSGSVASRTVNSATAFLQLGHESGYITPFLIAQYSGLAQSTDSSRVSGTNMSGVGYDIGGGLQFAIESFYISAAYLPWGAYDLTSKTSTGNQVSYSDPSIWMFAAGYKFGSFSFFVVQKFAEFSRSQTGVVTASLGDDKLQHGSTGGGVEWNF